jgi:TetR/AcrR family transcriptional repressor of mexJK operon
MPDKGRRHSGGRPSHDEAIKRDERLIEIAASTFMERGFEGTSIDAVAEAASEQAMTGRIEDVLLARARRTVAVALTPEAIAINRIVMAEATRFPNLAKLVHEQGWQRSNAAVATVLDGFAKNGQIEVEDTNVAADLFLSLVIGRQTRLAMLGIETDPAQIDQRVRAAVKLFLNGVRPRSNG